MALGFSQLSCGAQSSGVVSGKNVARSNGVMISDRARHGQIRRPACLRMPRDSLLHDDQKSSIAPVGRNSESSLSPSALSPRACFGTGAAPVPWSARRHWAVIWGMAKPGGDAVDIEGRAEEKTLDGVAARLTRKRQPCRGLDAFGDHLDRQLWRELRKRECDDLFRTRVAGLLDQRAIRLDAVDRQAPQVAMAEAPPLPKSSSATACRGLVSPKVAAAGGESRNGCRTGGCVRPRDGSDRVASDSVDDSDASSMEADMYDASTVRSPAPRNRRRSSTLVWRRSPAARGGSSPRLAEMRVRRDMRQLAAMDDHMLEDIGLLRCEVEYRVRYGRD